MMTFIWKKKAEKNEFLPYSIWSSRGGKNEGIGENLEIISSRRVIVAPDGEMVANITKT